MTDTTSTEATYRSQDCVTASDKVFIEYMEEKYNIDIRDVLYSDFIKRYEALVFEYRKLFSLLYGNVLFLGDPLEAALDKLEQKHAWNSSEEHDAQVLDLLNTLLQKLRQRCIDEGVQIQ